jgi:hypothetical protein
MSLSEKLRQETEEKGLVVHWPSRLKNQGLLIEKALDAYKSQSDEQVPPIRLQYQNQTQKSFLLPDQWSKHPVIAKNNLSESDLPMLRDFIVKLKQAEAKLGAEGQDSILFDDSDIVHQLISNGSELEFYKDDEKIESADDKEKIEHFQPAVREKRESASFKFEITKDDLLKSAIIVLLIVIYICLMLRLF